MWEVFICVKSESFFRVDRKSFCNHSYRHLVAVERNVGFTR